jgi:ParB family chromosome partitioning protein
MKSSRLGKGFAALLRRGREEVPEGFMVAEIPVAEIHPNPNQPRQDFDPESLAELVDSITRNGILQPIIVRAEATGYQLIAGERRWRAASQAGLATIPAIIRNATENESLELALIENIQRKNLNPIEQARAYRDLIERFGLTQEEAAERLGKNRSSIANILRLLDLPQDIQESVSRGTLTMGHARALLGLADRTQQRRIAERIVGEDLSVRHTERLVNAELRGIEQKPQEREEKPPHVLDLEAKLRIALGTRVTIEQLKADRGRVVIDFFSHDDFQRILGRLLTEDSAPGQQ